VIHPYGMNIALAAVAILIAISLYRTNRDNPDFNLVDLLMENKRVSKVSCLVMGSFGVHTWIMLYLTVHDKMSEGYLTIYGATWAAPLIVRLFNPAPPPDTHL